MSIDPALLDAMYYPQGVGAANNANAANYFNPAQMMMKPGTGWGGANWGRQGAASLPFQSMGGYALPNDEYNQLAGRQIGLDQTGQFLNKYGGTISSLLSAMMRPMGNIGFTTNFGAGASLAPTAAPAAH